MCWKRTPSPVVPGDGYKYQDIGYVMRGGREMDNHSKCMWDLFRSIPTPLRIENVTVLDEYYWLNKTRSQLTTACAAPPSTAARMPTPMASSACLTRVPWRF